MPPRQLSTRPPTLRRPPTLPTGPRLFRTMKNAGLITRTDIPPAGFVGGNNSRSEWLIYHALAKVLGAPDDPRLPPFIGAPGSWSYQSAFEGGRRQRGGAVIDFIVHAGPRSRDDVALRVVTEYFHIFTDAFQQAVDRMQAERISSSMRMVDLYDADFAADESGQAACVLVRRALQGLTFQSPLLSGAAERVRL